MVDVTIDTKQIDVTVDEVTYAINLSVLNSIGGSGGMTVAVYDPLDIADNVFDRSNHVGWQSWQTISDFEEGVAQTNAVSGVLDNFLYPELWLNAGNSIELEQNTIKSSKVKYSLFNEFDERIALMLPFTPESINGSTVNDYSKEQNNATAYNSPTYSSTGGPLDLGYYSLNGTTQYFLVPYDSSMHLYSADNPDFAVGIYVKTTTTSDSIMSVGASGAGGKRLMITVNSSGFAAVEHDDDVTKTNIAGTSSIDDDEWHLLVARLNGNTLSISVDGVVEGSADITGFADFNQADIPVVIGGHYFEGPFNLFTGDVALPFIMTNTLSDTELKRLYNKTTSDLNLFDNNINLSGSINGVNIVDNRIQVTGWGTPSSGKGLELGYFTSAQKGYIAAYDRDTGTGLDIEMGDVGGQAQFYLKFDTKTVGIRNDNPVEALDVIGNIAVSGTVDGIDLATKAIGWDAKGDVTKVGTPTNNQLGVWTGDGTIEGATGLTYDGSVFTTNATEFVMDGTTYNAALITEVGGEIIDFGTNYEQSGVSDLTNPGGFFRIDTRAAQASEFFNITYQSTGKRVGENQIFKVSTTGAVVTQDNLTVNGNISVSGTVDGVDLATKATEWNGKGDVTKVGTPVNNQLAVWTGDGTIEGDAGLTYDGTTFTVADDSLFGSDTNGKIKLSNSQVAGVADIYTDSDKSLRISNHGLSTGASLQLKDSDDGYLFSFEGKSGFRYYSRNTSSEVFKVDDSGNLNTDGNAKIEGQAWSELDVDTYAASYTPDFDGGNVKQVTLTGNITINNPTNIEAGATYLFILKQDATGSRTVSFGTSYKFPSGTAPTLSTGANAVDILSFVSDGTNLYGVFQGDFS